jgi:hypothetical protein
MTAMQSEMVTYANIDDLKTANDRVTALLERKRAEYQRRSDMARQQVNQLSSRSVDVAAVREVVGGGGTVNQGGMVRM